MFNKEQIIKDRAKALGFSLVGITTAEPISADKVEYFKKWLSDSKNGQMSWLSRNIDKRFDPTLLLTGAKSVICVAINYKPDRPAIGPIATYALYQDYHKFIKEKLFTLAEYLKDKIYSGLKFKACVDSVPIAERPFAARSGLGFIGKNHLLTNPILGSFLLLGELVTNLELQPDKPLKQKDYCGDCRRCIDNCPTGAISEDFSFDANKCLSYLTIESEEEIPEQLSGRIGNSIFGCDRCLFACPYNKNTPACNISDFKISLTRANLQPEKVLELSQAEFDNIFSDSAVSRTGLAKLKSTAAFCIKNNNQ